MPPVRELSKDDIIYPYFVTGGTGKKEKIDHFPGQYRFSIDRLMKDVAALEETGLNKILLFGVPDSKDQLGSKAYEKNNIVSRAVKEIKKKFPGLTVITDVCLCAYTSHGHCGIIQGHKVTSSQGRLYQIDTEATLEALAKTALAHAEAGADYVAPSAMAKRQVYAVRKALDKNGYRKTKILGYSAKFASNFYGPFRNAANSAPKFGDRKRYQVAFDNIGEALKEVAADIREGADIVMVKPALGYLDVIKEAAQRFNKPLAAYNVSGEYAFVKYGARHGLWDEESMIREIITAIKRAGADFIITYHAKEAAKWLRA